MYEGDTVKVKREQHSLRKEDQTLNFNDNINEFKDDRGIISVKNEGNLFLH
jgi:hypothetical protein